MVPSGPPTPITGASPSLLRSNSGILGGAQAGSSLPPQASFPTLVSPRSQFSNISLLGNVPNVSSLLNHSYVNGGPNPVMSGPGSSQCGAVDNGAESDPLSSVGNGMASFVPSNMVNACPSGQLQGQSFSSPGNQLQDNPHPSQLEVQNFQQPLQQFSSSASAPSQQQQHHHHHQFQPLRGGGMGGLGGVGSVKSDPQVSIPDQNGSQLQQQQQHLKNLAPVKLEPQQLQTIRNMAPGKLESQIPDQSLFMQQQQQQQQQQQRQQQQQQQHFLHLSRQSSQAAAAQINLLHQQRLLQLQQHQQQQLLKALPQQRSQLQQQFQQQNLSLRSPMKSGYEPGTCSRRLTHYMYQQQHRPEDNNIEFWRKFVSEYFAPNAKKKWCVSMYGSGRQTTGVFPQDVWHCEICNRKPGRGFEATFEVLPRLFKIKYESGTLEELLYIDMPREYLNSLGQIVLDYAKAIQESVFEQLRVVREGQLRVIFSLELKICSWEFCARRHEELIPRRLLVPQVTQLAAATQKYQAAAQNSSTNLTIQELQNNCNIFANSSRQLAKVLEVPLVNDLGYTKRYVRCLQISEVVNSMKDLIDYSRETGSGPMESLAKFPRRSCGSMLYQQSDEPQLQPMAAALGPNEQCSSVQPMPNNNLHILPGNGVQSMNNPHGLGTVSASPSTIVGLLHQNSLNSRQQSSVNNASSPYGANSVQMPSPSSSGTVPQVQQHNPSSFHASTPSSNNQQQGGMSVSTNSPANIALQQQQQQQAYSGEGDHGDSQSSVQKIIQEMMMSNQLNGQGGMVGVGVGSLVSEGKGMGGGILPVNNNMVLHGGNGFIGNGMVGGSGFGAMGNGIPHSSMVNGIRASMGSNMIINGPAGMARDQNMNHHHHHHHHHQQQQDLGNHLLAGIGSVNGFGNFQFDWKQSP